MPGSVLGPSGRVRGDYSLAEGHRRQRSMETHCMTNDGGARGVEDRECQ